MELVVPVSIIVFSPSFLSSQMEIKYRIILSVSANSTDPHKKNFNLASVSHAAAGVRFPEKGVEWLRDVFQIVTSQVTRSEY